MKVSYLTAIIVSVMSRAPLDLDEDAVRKARMIERFTGILEASRAAAPAVVAATVAPD